jgi:hypothetical protein
MRRNHIAGIVLIFLASACADEPGDRVGQKQDETTIKHTADEISYAPPEGVTANDVQKALTDLYARAPVPGPQGPPGEPGEPGNSIGVWTDIQTWCTSIGWTLQPAVTVVSKLGPYKTEVYCASPSPVLVAKNDPVVLDFATSANVTIQNLGGLTTTGEFTCVSGDCDLFQIPDVHDGDFGDYCSNRPLLLLGECTATVVWWGYPRCFGSAVFQLDAGGGAPPAQFDVQFIGCIL